MYMDTRSMTFKQKSEDNLEESVLFFHLAMVMGLNSNHQAWQQAPLPSDASCQPLQYMLKNKNKKLALDPSSSQILKETFLQTPATKGSLDNRTPF